MVQPNPTDLSTTVFVLQTARERKRETAIFFSLVGWLVGLLVLLVLVSYIVEATVYENILIERYHKNCIEL